MLSSSFLDVAIGIAFVFLLLSLLASTLNEIILSFLNMRGRELLRGVETLLSDDAATGLVSKIYNHGQIFGLFKGNFDPNKPGNLPSYIPSKNFVLALLDVVEEEADTGVVGDKIASLSNAAKKLAADPKTEKVGKPLVSLMETADGNLERLKTSLEDWYNSAMDRVSGWYKYRTQWVLLIIGSVLAVILNANAISIVQQLSRDATVRESIVAAAQSYKQPSSEAGQTLKDQIEQTNEQISRIHNIGIPLGWPQREEKESWWDQKTAVMQRPGTWFGWLITAVAVSLGAPFWFDMLNKIMVVRSTVKPREKSKEEASKDPTRK